MLWKHVSGMIVKRIKKLIINEYRFLEVGVERHLRMENYYDNRK